MNGLPIILILTIRSCSQGQQSRPADQKGFTRTKMCMKLSVNLINSYNKQKIAEPLECPVFGKILTSMLSLASETAVSRRGNIVSNPGKPGGGVELFFSSTAWGAAKRLLYNTFVVTFLQTLMAVNTYTCRHTFCTFSKQKQLLLHVKVCKQINFWL